MVAPRRFFEAAAAFEPYNQHFVQDIGAFQIGLGAVLVLSVLLARVDGLTTGLLGVGVGSAAHVISHLVGRDLGGTPEVDIPVFAVMTCCSWLAGSTPGAGCPEPTEGRRETLADIADPQRAGGTRETPMLAPTSERNGENGGEPTSSVSAADITARDVERLATSRAITL